MNIRDSKLEQDIYISFSPLTKLNGECTNLKLL